MKKEERRALGRKERNPGYYGGEMSRRRSAGGGFGKRREVKGRDKSFDLL